MVEIGGKPIIWHIMKLYSSHGIVDFVVCLGYRGYMIKEYFANYFLHMSDVTIDMKTNSMEIHQQYAEPWRITLVDTGDSTNTGGRLKRVRPYLTQGEDFCFTYGDGLTDADLTSEITFHRKHRRLATVLAVTPPGRYGALTLDDSRVTSFEEKPIGDGHYINGGYFVLSPDCIDLIEGDGTSWEEEPLRALAASDQLRAFRHDGFWQPMDTLRERKLLESLWASGDAPWMVW
jgi:glucose-1-phosphate cytidylyltransferase